MSRGITVPKLRELLDQLNDSDIISPNRLGNLLVIRDDELWAFITCRSDEDAEIELFEDDDDDEDDDA